MIQYIIFWHQEGVQVKDRVVRALQNPNLQHFLRGEISLYEDDQYLLLEIPFAFNSDKNKNEANDPQSNTSTENVSSPDNVIKSGWMELAPTEIKLQIETCRAYNQSLINVLTSTVPNITHLQTYYLFQVGSKEDYWFETRIDIERLKQSDGMKERSLREISSKTRLEILSEVLGGFKSLFANKITGTIRNSMLIGFGTKTLESSLEDYPRIFMQVVEVDDFYTGTGQETLEFDSMYYQITGNFTTNFGKFLMYHSKLMALHNIGYMEANVRATDIKTKAQRMQREINNLIRESQKLRQEKTSSSTQWYIADKMRAKQDYDEGLLYNASIYFSHITELLQTVSNAIYLSKENSYFLTKSANTMAFEPVNNPLTIEKTEHVSLIDEFRRSSDQVTHAFESLKLEIEATQVSLRNTVDVLKTFLEGKQRQSSRTSSKTLGLLTVVFACFVFVDMISNYFIYYLESTRSTEKLSETIIALIITLWPPVIMFVLLYYLFLKKIW